MKMILFKLFTNGSIYFTIETYKFYHEKLKLDIKLFFSEEAFIGKKCDSCSKVINALGFIENFQLIINKNTADSIFVEVDFILCEKCFNWG